jgi:hypothetical protein
MSGIIKTIKKGRGGARPGAGRKRFDIAADRERQRRQHPEQAAYYDSLLTPLDYLLGVMRDASAEWSRRDDAARAALPYCHRRLAAMEIGKKQIAEQEATTAGEGTDWSEDLQFSPSKAN